MNAFSLHLVLLVITQYVAGNWREVITNFTQITDNYPFIPHYDDFLMSSINEGNGDDSICDAYQLRQCLVNHQKLNFLHIGNDAYSAVNNDDDDKFDQSCRISAYIRKCFESSGCLHVQSLLRVGIDWKQTSLILLADKIEEIRCDDSRYLTNRQCLSRVFTEQREHFDDCAKQIEKLFWLKDNSRKACKAIDYYGECVRTMIEKECGSASGDLICRLTEAIGEKLQFTTEICDSKCGQRFHLIDDSHHVLPDWQSTAVGSDGSFAMNHHYSSHCDVERFKQCSDQFKKEIGIEGACVFDFLKQLKEFIYKRGKQGFEAVCEAGKNFDKCDDGKISGCFEIDSLLKKMNFTSAEAWALNITVFVLKYECEHEEFDKNFDCLMKTHDEKQAILERCVERFRKELKKHAHGLPCKAGQQFMDCVSSPFKYACGYQAAKAVCNLEMAILHQYGPHMRGCPFHCDI